MNTPMEKHQFAEMVVKFLNEELCGDELEQFISIMHSVPAAAQYYIDSAVIDSLLRGRRALITEFGTSAEEVVLDPAFWNALSKHEQSADRVDITEPFQECGEPLIRQVNRQNIFHKPSKLSIFSLIVSSAAILFMVLFARFMPAKRGAIVAVLTDSVGAEWASVATTMQDGQALMVGPMRLVSGLAEIVFESGGTVLVEGPADFVLEGKDQVYLSRGRMTATVPAPAIGFTVRTPKASVVDYGTEFGVLVQEDGLTETCVFTGEVDVRLGSNVRMYTKSQRLFSGQGAVAYADDIVLTPPRRNTFLRQMPSSYDLKVREICPHVIWREGLNFNERLFPTAVSTSVETLGTDVQSVAVTGMPAFSGLNAAKFNGASGYRISAVSKTSPSKITSFSYMLWCKVDGAGAQDLVVDRTRAYQSYRSISLNDKNRIVYSLSRTAGGARNAMLESTSVINAGEWYHIAIVRDEKHKKLFINGKLDSSVEQDSPTGMIYETIYVGGVLSEGQNQQISGLRGEIAELMGFSRGLKDEEVRAVYEAAAMPL